MMFDLEGIENLKVIQAFSNLFLYVKSKIMVM
jgi:hypothetical protein